MNLEIITSAAIIYVIGFVLSLIFLNVFGKKIGLHNYDEPQDYSNYDDYKSNAEAFLILSIFWPPVYIMFSIVGIYNVLLLFSKHLYKIYNG